MLSGFGTCLYQSVLYLVNHISNRLQRYDFRKQQSILCFNSFFTNNWCSFHRGMDFVTRTVHEPSVNKDCAIFSSSNTVFRFTDVRRSSSIIPIFKDFAGNPRACSARSNNSTAKQLLQDHAFLV